MRFTSALPLKSVTNTDLGLVQCAIFAKLLQFPLKLLRSPQTKKPELCLRVLFSFGAEQVGFVRRLESVVAMQCKMSCVGFSDGFVDITDL